MFMPNRIVLIKTDVQPVQTYSLYGSATPITLEAGTYTVCKDGFKFGKFVVGSSNSSSNQGVEETPTTETPQTTDPPTNP